MRGMDYQCLKLINSRYLVSYVLVTDHQRLAAATTESRESLSRRGGSSPVRSRPHRVLSQGAPCTATHRLQVKHQALALIIDLGKLLPGVMAAPIPLTSQAEMTK